MYRQLLSFAAKYPFCLIAFLTVFSLTQATAQVPSSSHVILVIEENTSYSSVTNTNNSTTYMPWLVGEGNTYGHATNYFSDSGGSLLDYLWLSSGSCHADATNCSPSTLPAGTNQFGCTGGGCSQSITDDNIFRELIARGMTWKVYLESLPSVGYMGNDTGEYAIRHNPAKWYSDIINSTSAQQHMVPFTQFATDLANNTLPQYSIIVPNLLDDAHDGSPAAADAWLSSNVAPVLNQSYFKSGGDGILIITFDNGDADVPGQVYTAVIGPKVRPGFTSGVSYKHENALRTILDALQISTHPGASAGASPMSDFFTSNPPPPPPPSSDLTATGNWLASTASPRVSLADGAVVDDSGSTRINPYFANLGVVGWTKDPNHYTNVKNYMNWYWAKVNWPDKFGIYGSINDFDFNPTTGAETSVPDPDSSGNLHPDSTDAYAGTFLSLAYNYYQTGDPGAQSYITSIQPPNSSRLDYVGEVIVHTKQSNGNNLTWARPDFNIEYLINNCEAYRGLRDLANLYTAYGLTSQASFYTSHADQMQNGIQTALWNSPNNNYFWYTTDSGTNGVVNWNTWYPDSVSQVYPIALGVIAPTDSRAISLWTAFESHWAGQWPALATGDTYPWTVVAYVAQLMGDNQDVNTFLNNIHNTYVTNNFAGKTGHFWSTNEAGWFMRTNAGLPTSGTAVTVSTPATGATVGASVTLQAAATSPHGINGWHIYDNGTSVFSGGAVSSISASLSLTSGIHRLVVRAWDNVSGFGDQTIYVTVP
jgi:acid phosphatase